MNVPERNTCIVRESFLVSFLVALACWALPTGALCGAQTHSLSNLEDDRSGLLPLESIQPTAWAAPLQPGAHCQAVRQVPVPPVPAWVSGDT